MAMPLSVRSMESATAATKAFQPLSICELPPPRLRCASARGKSVGIRSSGSRRVLLRPLRVAIPPEDSDGWGKDAADDGPGEGFSGKQDGATAVAPPKDEKKKKQEEDCGPDTSSLKKALLSSLYGADRGLKASSETRAEINELLSQLEAQNPTPAPTEALTLLNGKWILVYTSFSELFPLLAAGTLPLVKVGEISQTIDSYAFTVQNSVTFSGPLATTSFSASASFEVRSPKRVQIKFEEGMIGTPKLTDSIDIPDNVEVMGRKIDLTPVQGILRPLQDAATSVARTISGQPPLKFPFYGSRAQSWLLTTYLDEDLRISRGDGGSVFLLIKDGSALQVIAPST